MRYISYILWSLPWSTDPYSGVMAASENLIPQGRLHMRPIQWYLKSHWQASMPLETNISMSHPLHRYWSGGLIQSILFKEIIHTWKVQLKVLVDGSNWGAHCGDKKNLEQNSEARSHENILFKFLVSKSDETTSKRDFTPKRTRSKSSCMAPVRVLGQTTPGLSDQVHARVETAQHASANK